MLEVIRVSSWEGVWARWSEQGRGWQIVVQGLRRLSVELKHPKQGFQISHRVCLSFAVVSKILPPELTFFKKVNEEIDNFWIERNTGIFFDITYNLEEIRSLPIRSVGTQGVPNVDDREYSCGQRNPLAF